GCARPCGRVGNGPRALALGPGRIGGTRIASGRQSAPPYDREPVGVGRPFGMVGACPGAAAGQRAGRAARGETTAERLVGPAGGNKAATSRLCFGSQRRVPPSRTRG